jgi:serine protease AprX
VRHVDRRLTVPRSQTSPPSRGTRAAKSRRGPEILSIAERLGADPELSGRGVTIAFLDSGFFAHPDLCTPRDRIAAYHDLTTTRRTSRRALLSPSTSAWHGMMTSVVAAGNGSLSGGFYRGLAHESEVVLVKVGSAGRIVHDDIRRGIEWVVQHRARFGIRVLNISCGGDYEASYLTDRLSRAAEAAAQAGITVIAAVGNAGHQARPRVLPPASAPSVITVGGFNDGGRGHEPESYHSSYGPTLDGLQKPEIIAPAIYVAAPILPGTPTADQAKLIALLDEADDGSLRAYLAVHAGVDAELDAVAEKEPYLIRQLITAKRRDHNVISGHYKHVDGTSFAAPIVSSVVAQMLEAKPNLTPQQIKYALIRSARRLPAIDVDRQGWGMVQPRDALAAAREA